MGTASSERDQLDALSHAIRLLLRAGHEANVGLAARLELGASDVAALDLLALEGHMGPAAIADRLGIRTASATALVDRLEAAGHVRRVRDPQDRRRVAVVPTAHAEPQVVRAMRPMLQALDAAARELSATEQEAVGRYLARVTAALRASR